jgi:RNA polymerase sigma-70 factor (family 1)
MADITLGNEAELLAKIATGDQHAFKVIYQRFNRQIFTYCVQMLGSEVLAEEVMQEVFLTFWRMGDELLVIRNAEAYLRTLTKNRCLNVLRRVVLETKADRELTKNYVEYHNETEESILLNDTKNLINAAIELLPKQQREVYVLCQNNGLKYEEVAKLLGISVNTVKTHMKRALAAVRAYVEANTDVGIILILLKLL